ncbi:hypothetical protein [uncultured Georgenia sp.]|uniref:hypothetical protein n=1 Tax=uncultured Georgenia sp. TaxID=378209 RepID=UPI00260A2355|nr:hypothetical protein [uncultured Georgenia sp.]HLV04932.1 hypothetical protein [Actinomycetaceae bacterium]
MRWSHPALLIATVWVLVGCGVVTDPTEVTPDVYVETPSPNPRAAAVFGQDNVDDAVEQLTGFALSEAYPPELLDPQREDYSVADLAGDDVVEHLTPDAAEGWTELVEAALAGDAEARSIVHVMRFYDVERRWTLPEDDPVVASQQITDIVLEVDSSGGAGQERLVVSFHHDVSLEYREDGRPVGMDIAKEITYQLAPVSDPDGPGWLIAGFDGEFEVVDWS